MSYTINAWFERGEPRLGIVSARTGAIKHLWRLTRIENTCGEGQRSLPCEQQSGIQQLVRALFLIGCAEEISLVQRAGAGAMGDACLSCGICLEEAATDAPAPLASINGRST